MICGIDFGSRKAGTTAICWYHQQLQLASVKKGDDADRFLVEWVETMQPSYVFIDAPLSIPSAIIGKGNDYMYRQCDRDLHAMSPMFLGGLTARAIRLKDLWQAQGVPVYEVYPGGCVRNSYASLMQFYKKDIQAFVSRFFEMLPYVHGTNFSPANWHEVDAILAWEIGSRYLKNRAQVVGLPEEGLIYF